MLEIKIGFLVAYDYKYLYNSLPLVYSEANKIVLAIDKSRHTWSGIAYSINNDFFDWIKHIDCDNKIEIYEDNFYVPSLSTTECDTRERNMLAKALGEGGWHIQIDSDEYFLNFNQFVKELHKLEKKAPNTSVSVFTRFITLYKQLDEGVMYVNDSFEQVPLATNTPNYSVIRQVKGSKKYYTNCFVLHQSWARTNEEIKIKLSSWGHNDDFHTDSYFNLWESIDQNNYKYMHNFHPLIPRFWKSLFFVPETDIQKLIPIIQAKLAENKPRLRDKIIKVMKLILPPIFPTIIYKTYSLIR